MPGKSEASLLLDSLFHVDSVIVMIAIVVVSWLPCEDVFFVDPGLPQPFFHAPWRREDSGNQMLSRTVCSMFSFFTIKNHQTFINFGVATVFEQPFWDDYDWSTKIPCGAVSLDRSHVGAVPGCAVPPENLNAFLRAEMQTCLGRCILDQAAINSMMTYISYILIWKKTLERGQKTPRYQEMSKTYIVFFEQILWKPWILQDFYVELGRCQALIRVTLTCGPTSGQAACDLLGRANELLRHEQLISIHWLNMAKPYVKTPAVKPCIVHIIVLLCSVGSKVPGA